MYKLNYNYLTCIIGKKFGFTDFVNPTLCGDKKISEVWQ